MHPGFTFRHEVYKAKREEGIGKGWVHVKLILYSNLFVDLAIVHICASGMSAQAQRLTSSTVNHPAFVGLYDDAKNHYNTVQ
jgi:hypothetical protein